MSLVAEAFSPRLRASTGPGWSALDERWYVRDISGYIAEASGGIAISAESIMRCGTVLAAVRFRGDSWAMCPPSVFKRTARGREDDPMHPVQDVLRHPNAWQTGNRWRHTMGVWMATWGNAYSRIVPGRRYFLGELHPIHPSKVRLKDQREDGTLVYEVQRPNGGPEEVGGEKLLHFRDLGTDGFQGLEMYRLIRNVVGIALLAEQHAATFLRKGTRVSGLIVPSSPLTQEQRKDLRESINADMGGANVTGTLGVLPHGVEVKPLGINHREAQFMELNDQVVGSILRFLGVPGVVVGWMGDKTSTFASAEAFFEKGGIKHCVLPILTNVEAEEEKSLLMRGDGRFIRHNLDVLQRANLKDRYLALSKALGGAPFLSVNDVRGIEDWNPDPDPRHDEIRVPVNLMPPEEPDPNPEPPPTPPRPVPPEDDGEDGEDGGQASAVPQVLPPTAREVSEAPRVAKRQREDLVAHYARDNAERIVRRELANISARGRTLARDPRAWRAWVLSYYEGHAEHVAQVMRITEDQAKAYCDRQAAALLSGGVAAAAAWESEVPPQLVAVALEEQVN